MLALLSAMLSLLGMSSAVQIWDAHAPNLGLISLTHFVGHKFSQVMAIQVSPDGSCIASGGSDFVVKLWKKEPVGEIWKARTGHPLLAVTNGNFCVLSVLRGRPTDWNVAAFCNGVMQDMVPTGSGHTSIVTTVNFRYVVELKCRGCGLPPQPQVTWLARSLLIGGVCGDFAALTACD